MWKAIDQSLCLQSIMDCRRIRDEWLQNFKATYAPGTVKSYLGMQC